ncbi:unnamed protein product [Thelazia callipaeda]|uniref:Papilin n=1 Tax=Thelazia callipaeda TaxID=103827 RepID=A0A0N5D9Y3_THECL|nr:unnamed protein product [Thelazia callipaeda]
MYIQLVNTSTGCGGNGNNYPSKSVCEKQCVRSAKCKNGMQAFKTENGRPLHCTKNTCPSGYYCSISQPYSICCPNKSSNETVSSTLNIANEICQLPKERGPCDKYELRFYYNKRLGECKYFFFGGCEGNANNFERVEECERTCRQRGIKTALTTIVSAPQLITQGPQLKKLNKEYATKSLKKTEEDQSRELIVHAIDENSQEYTSTSDALESLTSDVLSTSYQTDIIPTSTLAYESTTVGQIFSTDIQNIMLNTDKFVKLPARKKTTNEFRRKQNKFHATTPGSEISLEDESNKPVSTTLPSTNSDSSTDFDDALAENNEQSSLTTSAKHTLKRQSLLEYLCDLYAIESLIGSAKERCNQKRDPGTCLGQFIRWHWDAERRTCQIFTYSGCGGNGNNFGSRNECFAACHQPPKPTPDLHNVCEHSIDPGDCTGVFQRFAFDSATKECRAFTYSGCGGNGNNFGSALECRQKCHPVEVGECSSVFPRFAYDQASNECRPFTYGGCGGNGNNFASITECQKMCVKELSLGTQCPPINVSHCLEPCILFSNRLGCHECRCPVTQPETEKVSMQISTPIPTTDDSSQIDQTSQAEKSLENDVEKKAEQVPPPEQTSKVNSVIELGEKCTQPMEPGPCKNFIERWHFDIKTGLCKSFQYGGCAGNRNHFFSKHECEIHCARFLRSLYDNSLERENEKLSTNICLDGRTGRRRIAAYQSVSSRSQNNDLTSSEFDETLLLNEHEHTRNTDNIEKYNTVMLPHEISQRRDDKSDLVLRRQANEKLKAPSFESLANTRSNFVLASSQAGKGKSGESAYRTVGLQHRQSWSGPLGHRLAVWVPESNKLKQSVISSNDKVMHASPRIQIDKPVHREENQVVMVKEKDELERTASEIKTEVNSDKTEIENSIMKNIHIPIMNSSLLKKKAKSEAVTEKFTSLQEENLEQRAISTSMTATPESVTEFTPYNSSTNNLDTVRNDIFNNSVAKQLFAERPVEEQVEACDKNASVDKGTACISSESHKQKLQDSSLSSELREIHSKNSLPSNEGENEEEKVNSKEFHKVGNNEETHAEANINLPEIKAKNLAHIRTVDTYKMPKDRNRISGRFTDLSIQNDLLFNDAQSKDIHKKYSGAMGKAPNTDSMQLSRDSVLRHHIRIINQGSASKFLSSVVSPLISSPSTTAATSSTSTSSVFLLSKSVSASAPPSTSSINLQSTSEGENMFFNTPDFGESNIYVILISCLYIISHGKAIEGIFISTTDNRLDDGVCRMNRQTFATENSAHFVAKLLYR